MKVFSIWLFEGFRCGELKKGNNSRNFNASRLQSVIEKPIFQYKILAVKVSLNVFFFP